MVASRTPLLVAFAIAAAPFTTDAALGAATADFRYGGLEVIAEAQTMGGDWISDDQSTHTADTSDFSAYTESRQASAGGEGASATSEGEVSSALTFAPTSPLFDAFDTSGSSIAIASRGTPTSTPQYQDAWAISLSDSVLAFTLAEAHIYTLAGTLTASGTGYAVVELSEGTASYNATDDVVDIVSEESLFDQASDEASSFNETGTLAAGSYVLAFWSGVDPLYDPLITSGEGYSGDGAYSGQLTLTPVPEPTSLALLAGLGGLMLLRRRPMRQG